MKRIIIGIIVVAAIVGGLVWFQKNDKAVREPADRPQDSATAEHIITKTDAGFTPKNITIKVGDKVIFKNESTRQIWPASNIHPTHTIYPEFDSRKGIPTGGSYSFIFEKIGAWPYHDHLDPASGGVITVE